MDQESAPKLAKEGDHQCQHVSPERGQCPFLAVAPGANCLLHGGTGTLKKQQKADLYAKMAAEYRQRVAQFRSHEDHYSLQDEIGILRMLLEQHIVSCQTESSLLARSPVISELVVKIQKLIDSSMRAEKYIGSLMSRTQAQKFLQDVINAIAEEISDYDMLERIARKFEAFLAKEYKDDESATS